MALHRDAVTGAWGVPRDATPTTHIIKPIPLGLQDHHINEVLCHRAAVQLGLPAAGTEIIEAGDVQAIVSVRYDRAERSGTLRRLHQEDLCQALSVHPSLKYQSDGGPGVAEIADLFARLEPADGRVSAERFFDALVYNVLIAGTDAHAKNYSLLLSGSRAQLAPLYDLASAAPYAFDGPPVSAMKVGGHAVMRQISTADWERTARRLGLGSGDADRVNELRVRLPEALASAVGTLPPEVGGRAEELTARIVQHADSLGHQWGSRRA